MSLFTDDEESNDECSLEEDTRYNNYYAYNHYTYYIQSQGFTVINPLKASDLPLMSKIVWH
jgi:hypothetical protein